MVFYATAELLLMVFAGASTWDTPLLFVYLGGVSVMMFFSHRNWFARLEADLEAGDVEQAEGPVRLPHPIEGFFTPALRYAVFVDEERYVAVHGTGRDLRVGECFSVTFLPRVRMILDASETRKSE